MPDWVSAKDVILEMLRRHGVHGGYGRIIEYHGPGIAGLSAMDRHVIADIGAELGARPPCSPRITKPGGSSPPRTAKTGLDKLVADDDAAYDVTDEIDLSELVPLVALPSSPGNVKPVSEVEGVEISQVLIGSSANPGCVTSKWWRRSWPVGRPTVQSRSTSTRPRDSRSRSSPIAGRWRRSWRPAPGSTRPAAWDASASARRPPAARRRCEPSHGTSRAGRAPRTIRCTCARPRRRPSQR